LVDISGESKESQLEKKRRDERKGGENSEVEEEAFESFKLMRMSGLAS